MTETKVRTKNPMENIEIEKMVINCGGIDDKLDRSVNLSQLKREETINLLSKTLDFREINQLEASFN